MTAEDRNDSMSVYEGMFLFPQAATADLQAAVDHIKALLTRAGAELISLSKWDERRLAYEIKGNKRGVYFLTYFRAPRDKMVVLERGCTLSEQLLRTLFTRADHLSDEMIQAADGQAKLADEIKLRKEAPPPPAQRQTPEPELQPVGAAEDDGSSVDDSDDAT
jgi:small subunit ribosomal protein S6